MYSNSCADMSTSVCNWPPGVPNVVHSAASKLSCVWRWTGEALGTNHPPFCNSRQASHLERSRLLQSGRTRVKISKSRNNAWHCRTSMANYHHLLTEWAATSVSHGLLHLQSIIIGWFASTSMLLRTPIAIKSCIEPSAIAKILTKRWSKYTQPRQTPKGCARTEK